MDGYSISQVARRSGFPASTLRFYEQSGLLRPGRTTAGYRCYDESHLDLLGFIGRAKALGCSLDEIGELVGLLADDRCEPVQGRLRDLVEAKLGDARRRRAELDAFVAELGRAARTLAVHTPDGPCDATCGCRDDPDPQPDLQLDPQPDPDPDAGLDVGSDVAPDRAGAIVPVDAPRRRPVTREAPIACSLDGPSVAGRLEAWRTALADVTDRESIPGGVRLRLPTRVDVASLAGLAAAEQGCCAFLAFTLAIGADGIVLEVTAADGTDRASGVIAELVGHERPGDDVLEDEHLVDELLGVPR